MTMHKLAVIYLFVNVIGNFLLCVCTNTNTRKLKWGRSRYSDIKEECEKCRMPQPKRTHHCRLCQSCILKQDHHCFFMTVCIGYYNQKHFIMYCFYMSVGAFYAMVLLAKYLNALYGVRFYGPHTFLVLLLNLIKDFYFGRYPPTLQLFLLLVLYSCLVMGTLSAGFFFWQMAISVNGQTTHEAWEGDETFSLKTIWGNLRDVFGRGWPFLLFLPLPLSQTGDGVYGTRFARAARGKRKRR